MKEYPIPFTDAMVLAILEGRKRQTRRKAKVPFFEAKSFRIDADGRVEALVSRKQCKAIGIPGPLPPGDHWRHVVEGKGRIARCPYGVPGDRLWVKETWRPATDYISPLGSHSTSACIEFKADGAKAWLPIPEASREAATQFLSRAVDGRSKRWRPGRFMPRWASRILLENKGVRIQRLQDITEEDAAEEGARHPDMPDRIVRPYSVPFEYIEVTNKMYFTHLWEVIHGTGSWAANDLVFAISFERIDP